MMNLLLLLVAASHCLSTCLSFDVLAGFSITAGGIASSYLYCKVKECCAEPWVKNVKDLSVENLKSNIFGQDYSVNKILRAILGHIRTPQPSKALAISINGPPGVGKNHFVTLLADLLFKKGLESKFVRVLIGVQDFNHVSTLKDYQSLVLSKIKATISNCPSRSLIIFDEVDKIPFSLLDTLKPLLDHYKAISGLDFRKSIFIFIGNQGQSFIANWTKENFEAGRDRYHKSIVKLERNLRYHLFSSAKETGFSKSALIPSGIIDFFVPFLPLERKHVKQCILHHLKAYEINNIEECISSILENTEFFNFSGIHEFAVDGCRKIDNLIILYCDVVF